MKRFKHNTAGFSTVEVILVILVVIIVGFAAWYVWHNNSGKSVHTANTSQNLTSKTDFTVNNEQLPAGWNKIENDAGGVSLTNATTHCSVNVSYTPETKPPVQNETYLEEMIATEEGTGYTVRKIGTGTLTLKISSGQKQLAYAKTSAVYPKSTNKYVNVDAFFPTSFTSASLYHVVVNLQCPVNSPQADLTGAMDALSAVTLNHTL